MKGLFFGAMLIMAFTVSCVKANKKNTDYRIEASASNIEDISYNTRDHGPQELYQYNQSSFELEWEGYKVNEISVSITCDGPGVITVYKKDKVVAQQNGDGTVNLNYKN